ncbi:hypothetical protein ABIF07_001057 [Bradyrhizobium elkanii]|uniref:hypothetical protein n=1 Tax=Bradyrhizobium elkanii TaxID=29448 RepID=UPI002168AF92|nr:hypothetical protein [Bradyrhizobium elkanii]MCS3692027.1 hypothetical protein [Bradyrhizobium elkanii]
MIAKLAYLTTPSPGRYMLNIQTFGSDELLRFEIERAHLANILIDGTALALRDKAVSTSDLGEKNGLK